MNWYNRKFSKWCLVKHKLYMRDWIELFKHGPTIIYFYKLVLSLYILVRIQKVLDWHQGCYRRRKELLLLGWSCTDTTYLKARADPRGFHEDAWISKDKGEPHLWEAYSWDGQLWRRQMGQTSQIDQPCLPYREVEGHSFRLRLFSWKTFSGKWFSSHFSFSFVWFGKGWKTIFLMVANITFEKENHFTFVKDCHIFLLTPSFSPIHSFISISFFLSFISFSLTKQTEENFFLTHVFHWKLFSLKWFSMKIVFFWNKRSLKLFIL